MKPDFDTQKSKIISRLNEKAPDLKCPACGRADFSLGGGYFAHDLQNTLGQRRIGGLSIPTVPIICKHCGFVLDFAAGALGLLPEASEKERSDRQEGYGE